MATDREELQRLRELDRLAVLEAKAGGAPVQQAQPAAAPEKSFMQRVMSEGMLAPGKGKARGEAIARGELPSDIPLAANIPMTAGSGVIPKAASTMGGAIKAGAAEGALQGAGGSMREEDLGSRLGHTALGAGLGTIFGGISGLIGKGNQIGGDISAIKSGTMSDIVKSEIDDAAKAIDAKQLAPRDAKLRELIKGQDFEINPDIVESTFPNLAKTMKSKLGEGESRRALSPERALRLKRAADAAADYGQSKPFDPTASAKGEEAKSLADVLRRQVNANPEVASLNSEMADILAKKAFITKGAKSAPISTVRAQPGTDKDSIIKAVDKMAGSGLENLDSRIGVAKDLLLKPSALVKPLELPNELRKLVTRGGVSLAEGVSKAVPEGSKDAILAAALAASAPKQKRKK